MSDFDSIYSSVKPVPHATDSGKQEGVIPPGSYRPKPGTYKVVENHEAVANMVARKNGTMEKIVGGADSDTNREITAHEPTIDQASKLERHNKDTKDNFDLTDDDNTEEKLSQDSVLKEVAKALRELRADKADDRSHKDPGHNMANPYSEIGQYGHYHETKTVTMEIRQEHSDGTFTSIMTVGLPVSHVLQNSNSVTLITPITNNQYTFQPTAGSDILLNGGGINNMHVFYPGTSFVLDDYKLSGMCFVRAK